MCLAQTSATIRPVAIEPVKETASMSGDSSIVRPTIEPLPMTRFKTPFGKPARIRISTSSHAQPGTRSAGLNTTVLP
jgi:hypothetical protein